jgi:hypothetical protein
MGCLLSVLSSGSPMDIDKPHIWAYTVETVFLEKKVPFKFEKKI